MQTEDFEEFKIKYGLRPLCYFAAFHHVLFLLFPWGVWHCRKWPQNSSRHSEEILNRTLITKAASPFMTKFRQNNLRNSNENFVCALYVILVHFMIVSIFPWGVWHSRKWPKNSSRHSEEILNRILTTKAASFTYYECLLSMPTWAMMTVCMLDWPLFYHH